MIKKHADKKELMSKNSMINLDVFDCSKPDFFSRNDMLSDQDANRMFSSSIKLEHKLNQRVNIDISLDSKYLIISTDTIVKLMKFPEADDEK